MPDRMEQLAKMGWQVLPYGCIGLARRKNVTRDQVAWSWLILIPWAENDVKPWIDGTEVLSLSLVSEAAQREQVLAKMREILDKRYGETVAKREAERLIDRLRDES